MSEAEGTAYVSNADKLIDQCFEQLVLTAITTSMFRFIETDHAARMFRAVHTKAEDPVSYKNALHKALKRLKSMEKRGLISSTLSSYPFPSGRGWRITDKGESLIIKG